jgi:hypothetical protein
MPSRRLPSLGLLWAVLTGLALLVNAPAQADPLAGFSAQGSGEYRKFGFLVYEASLWTRSPDPLAPPFALALTYKRTISGRQLVDASVSEIRKLKVASDERVAAWGEELARIFPDVKAGDRIVGIREPGRARFLYNGRAIGEIADEAFANAFFGIWLAPGTSAPELRARLLGEAGR